VRGRGDGVPDGLALGDGVPVVEGSGDADTPGDRDVEREIVALPDVDGDGVGDGEDDALREPLGETVSDGVAETLAVTLALALGDAGGDVCRGADMVDEQRLGERREHGHARVERGVGVLEDHLQVAAGG
jgi:hypothetical protein